MAAVENVREYRGIVDAAEPGDEVKLAREDYDYANPLTVADIEADVTWRVPYGQDWLTKTLRLEGERGGEYLVVYNDALDVFAFHNDEGHRISGIVQFEAAISDEPMWDAGGSEADPYEEFGFPVPDHVTPAAIHDAVEACETLRGVVNELDWPVDDNHARSRVRALVFEENLYDRLDNAEGQP